MFRYDLDESQDEPASPHSQTSSTAPYSNLPSPLLTDQQLMPPPIVNRDLKPKRKLSDSHSISSNPESTSPRIAPSVDRKLKPPTPLQVSRFTVWIVQVFVINFFDKGGKHSQTLQFGRGAAQNSGRAKSNAIKFGQIS